MKFIFILVMFVSADCLVMNEFAENVMTMRQNGTPLSVAVSGVSELSPPEEIEEVMKAVIFAAYDTPLYQTEARKQEAITEFSNIVYSTCVENWE